MAVRVRKLAKEMDLSPSAVLGLLHAIGFGRYRTPDDMLPDTTVDHVKRAWKEGVKPVPLPSDVVTASRAEPKARPAPDDLMAKLVPGVTRVRSAHEPSLASRATHGEPPARKPPPEPPAPALVPQEPEGASVAAERAALAAERARVEQAAREVEAMRAELAEQQANLASAAADLEQRLSASRPPDGASLVDVLVARGLRGMDEFERTISALAATRQLGDLLTRLRVDDPEATGRWLRERILLVEGVIPEGLSVAAVVVARDRAELPDPAELQRRLTRTGELFLLNGLRRVLIVGGRPLWHRLLRHGIDPRVEIRFLAGTPRRRSDAESDVSRTDAVVLWATAADPDALELYRSSRALFIEVDDHDIVAALDAIERALTGD